MPIAKLFRYLTLPGSPINLSILLARFKADLSNFTLKRSKFAAHKKYLT